MIRTKHFKRFGLAKIYQKTDYSEDVIFIRVKQMVKERALNIMTQSS